MSEWDGINYAAKTNLMRIVDDQARAMFDMASAPGAWEQPTASPLWQVRDVVGHLIDVTESYFDGWGAAKGGPAVPDALGTPAMQSMLDDGAKALRNLSQDEALDRLRADYTRMRGLVEALGPEDWGAFTVSHKYMGPLPAFFYPVFQLMDYGVHGWDIRQGTGQSHGLDGDTADMLVPFMFILWSATSAIPADAAPCEVGIRVTTGHNAGSWRVTAAPSGVTYAPGEIDDVAATLEFDPGSFVLTAFGRSNAGTIRGDRAVAERYLNMFFRI